MSETISVTIPDNIKAQMDAFSSENGVSADDLILEALESYLFVRRFRDLRAKMLEQVEAQKPGGYTDEEIFGEVS